MRYLKNKFVIVPTFIVAAILLLSAMEVGAVETKSDSAMVIEGGADGKVFRKMTIEGEDRFRIDFERPTLRIHLDPSAAPGLDWDNTWDVLADGDIDLLTPLAATSAAWSSPYLPRPWLDEYAIGEIVRFAPSLTGVEGWKLTIVDSRSGEVRSFDGDGNPPDRIGWDGLSEDGMPMPPGYTYSYMVEAWDRAGNNRNFVGKGFDLPAYRVTTGDGMAFLFAGSHLGMDSRPRGSASEAPAPVLLEAASRINQENASGRSVRVVVMARTYDQAGRIGEEVARVLGELLIGDPARIRHVADVRDNAPEEGTIAVVLEDPGE